MRISRRFLASTASLYVAAVACSDQNEVPPGEMVLTDGQEAGVWTAKPAPVSAIVEQWNGSKWEKYETLSVPAEGFSMGLGEATSFRVTGRDADKQAVVVGQSVRLDPFSLNGLRVPLFISRAGTFARPAGKLDLPQGIAPLASSSWGRFVFSFGAHDDDGFIHIDGYDFFAWQPAAPKQLLECPEVPCEPQSLALVGDGLGMILGPGMATWFDLAYGTSGELDVPAELESYDDVSGGDTILAPNGSAIIVGGTRTGTATAAVITVSSTGGINALTTEAERQAAGAAWLDGHGLVVVGGSATEPGVELLASGAKNFVTLAFPADATTGAAIVAFGEDSVLRIGGEIDGAPAPTVEINVDCGDSCEFVEVAEPVALAQPRAFLVAEDAVLVVGDNAAGVTEAYRLTTSGVTPVALRQVRHGGTAVRTPTGHIALVGGVDAKDKPVSSIELYLE